MKCGYPNCDIVVVTDLWQKDGKTFCSLACKSKYHKGIERPPSREPKEEVKQDRRSQKRITKRTISLSRRIKFLRLALGLTGIEAAEITGISINTYRELERGYSKNTIRNHFKNAWEKLGNWEG